MREKILMGVSIFLIGGCFPPARPTAEVVAEAIARHPDWEQRSVDAIKKGVFIRGMSVEQAKWAYWNMEVASHNVFSEYSPDSSFFAQHFSLEYRGMDSASYSVPWREWDGPNILSGRLSLYFYGDRLERWSFYPNSR